MPDNHLIRIAIIITGTLMTMSASAADSEDAGVTRQEPSTRQSATINRSLAREANTSAAEDAIEAVLTANRLHLDIRLNGRTSGRTSEKSTNGR